MDVRDKRIGDMRFTGSLAVASEIGSGFSPDIQDGEELCFSP